MILVSGFNVYPNEVEAVVAVHPGVLECSAVGGPDANSGEAVMLFVVKKAPALTKEALDAYCHQELTGYKRPKYIEFRAGLPKANVGRSCAGDCGTGWSRRRREPAGNLQPSGARHVLSPPAPRRTP